MEEKLKINCKHGKGIASVVCGHHLSSNQAIGFVENSSDPNDLQGWCYACEFFFQQEGDRTSRFKKFNNAKMVCERCYDEIKTKHSID